jgi:O-antigen/teichoic acid export membrane protein
MRASLIVFGGNLVGAGAAFFAAIVAARSLPVDQFAAFGVGLAVNSLAVQFGDFGLGTVAIAETAGASSRAEARAKLRGLLLHRIGTALAVAALVAVAVLVLSALEPYRTAALVGAGGEVFGTLAFFGIWSLQGQRRFRSAAGLQALQGGLRFLLVGACALAGLGAVPMMAGYAVLAPLATALLAGRLLFARDRDDVGPEGSTEIDRGRRRTMAFTGVFAAMVMNGDVLLLAMLSGPHDVAAYSAAWRFSAGVLLANTALASALLPFIVTAPDAWAEAKLLVRRGLVVSAGWLALTPALAVVGPLLLGSIGDSAKTPLLVLLLAFAIDGFYFTVYQVYLRVHRERLLLVIAIVELVVMASVTIALRGQGASAPAFGQLAARVAACLIVVGPIGLAAARRCDWFFLPAAGRRDSAPALVS